jgi:hypothetical protein
MAGFLNQFFQGVSTGTDLKDYQHAARTFVDGLYRLGPKSGAMFHVFIDVNPQIYQQDNANPSTLYEIGLLAKTATLPKFTVQNKVLNAYNRKNIIQERITYDPITLTFHDDSSDIVRNFWYGYYSYYYRDSDHSEELYHQAHKYTTRQATSWGYTPLGTDAPNYINSIRIYSLHQKSFSSYILINPTITSFQHGQHQQGEYNTLEHSMSLAYEAVQYEYGPVTDGTVRGFNMGHYDNSPSPLTALGGGTQSILGPGGLVEGVGGILTNLQSGNFATAAVTAARMGTNFKGANLKTIATQEFNQLAKDVIRGQNTQSTIFVPTQASAQNGRSTSIYGIPKAASANKVLNMNSADSLIPSIGLGRIDL